jgi:hypothetical protein
MTKRFILSTTRSTDPVRRELKVRLEKMVASDMSDIEWKSPPEIFPDRAALVAKLLQSKPGEWARIVKDETVVFFPWWNPLYQSESYEFKFVHTGPEGTMRVFGPKDVYARYIEKSTT